MGNNVVEKKRVLVYPCGTEIGLEVYKALCFSKQYEVLGGTDSYDHGRFVFNKLIDNLPFIKDDSNEEDVIRFEKAIESYNIDFIYPAMDGVIAVFAKYRHAFKEVLIAPETDTAEMCRSKKATYAFLKDVIDIPRLYSSAEEITSFPVFAKPDKGQGAVGATKINNSDELIKIDFDKYVVMEYLPGKEYTIDCFTNSDGRLVYARARGRKRIKNGISVNSVFDDSPAFFDIAYKINNVLKQKGGWFFQLKEADDGKLKLLEVAARIAGTSALSRNIGANLPLLTVDIFNGVKVDDIVLNSCYIELDRALANVYKTDITYSTVYMDYDDTIVKEGVINTLVIRFLYQCVNKGKKLVLLSKHDGDLEEELTHYRIKELFDEVIHLERAENKKDYVKDKDSIFIDDSYGERKAIKVSCNIPVFDTHMVECLLEED